MLGYLTSLDGIIGGGANAAVVRSIPTNWTIASNIPIARLTPNRKVNEMTKHDLLWLILASGILIVVAFDHAWPWCVRSMRRLVNWYLKQFERFDG